MGHTGKAEVSTQTPQNNESPSCMSEDPKLLWLIGTLNGQQQPIRCYFCNGLNHMQRDCLPYKQQQNFPN